jgi:transposase
MVMLSKNNCFFLVYEKATTPVQATKQLGVNRRTAYNWVKKGQENPSDILELNNEKKVCRPSILNEVHKKHLISFYDDNPSAVFDQAMASLTSEFASLKIGKTAVYNFMTSECNLTFKKAHMYSIQRNSPDNIERRYEWVLNWVKETDTDYMSNCVLIDEAAFHINLKRSMAWSKKKD